MTAGLAYSRSRNLPALVAALVLSVVAFVLVASEAWAEEQPPQAAQQQRAVEGTVTSTTMINGQAVEPVAEETSPVEIAPVGTSPAENPSPSPSYSAPPTPPASEPAPQPAQEPTSQRYAVVITNGEVVESDAEPAPAAPKLESEPTPTIPSDRYAPGTLPALVEAERAATLGSAGPASDLGPSGEEIPAATEVPVTTEVPASTFVDSARSWASGPTIPPLTQQVASPVWPSSSPLVAPANDTMQPLTRALAGLARASAASAADVLGTIGGWLAESTSGGTDSPSGDIVPEPLAPLTPQPFGNDPVSLFSGGGQAGAGAAGVPLLPLLGILVLSSILLRRDVRTYLVSCEMPKPSEAVLSPLERPG